MRTGPFYYQRVSPRCHVCDGCEIAREEERESVRKGYGAKPIYGYGDLDVCLECLQRVRERTC